VVDGNSSTKRPEPVASRERACECGYTHAGRCWRTDRGGTPDFVGHCDAALRTVPGRLSEPRLTDSRPRTVFQLRDRCYVVPGCSVAFVSAAWWPMNSNPARIAGR
jgi:hypothetical protein